MKTKQYLWEGITREGEWTTGLFTAPSRLHIKLYLMKQGITLKKLRCVPKWQPILHPLSPKALTQLLYQLTLLLQADLPLLTCLNTLNKNRSSYALQSLLHEVIASLTSGLSLSESLKRYPQYFTAVECHLIQAGESSGTLLSILSHVVEYRLKMASLKQILIQALSYPMILICTGVVISMLLFTTIIPQFHTLFMHMGVAIPPLTAIVFTYAQWVQQSWKIGGCLLLLLMISLYGGYRASTIIHNRLHDLCLSCPVFGQYIQSNSIIRFARLTGLLCRAGLPLYEALEWVGKTHYWHPYIQAIAGLQTSIAAGYSLHKAMATSRLFPPLLTQMVSMGEASGNLEDMLEKTAIYYEQDMQNIVKRLSTFIEPVMIGILGVVVGGLVVAVYLPIFQLGSVF